MMFLINQGELCPHGYHYSRRDECRACTHQPSGKEYTEVLKDEPNAVYAAWERLVLQDGATDAALDSKLQGTPGDVLVYDERVGCDCYIRPKAR